MKPLLHFLYLLIGVYFLLCFLLFVLQNHLIFFPEKLSPNHTFYFSNDFEENFFEIDKNTRIHAIHFFAKNPRGVILYFHGNAGSLDGWGHVANDFVKMGYDVFMPEYRGYGKSTGKINEPSFYDDAQLVYDYLLEKYKEKEVVILGRSLGTGVAVDLASKTNPGQLILETPFVSFAQLGQKRFKVFPVKMMLKYQFDSGSKIKKVSCPIHIFHGIEDELIPYKESQQLINILQQPGILTTIPGGGHNNLAAFKEYWVGMGKIL